MALSTLNTGVVIPIEQRRGVSRMRAIVRRRPIEGLARLQTRYFPGGRAVTAGNSSQLHPYGASAVRADARGRSVGARSSRNAPLGRSSPLGITVSGCEPEEMGSARCTRFPAPEAARPVVRRRRLWEGSRGVRRPGDLCRSVSCIDPRAPERQWRRHFHRTNPTRHDRGRVAARRWHLSLIDGPTSAAVWRPLRRDRLAWAAEKWARAGHVRDTLRMPERQPSLSVLD